MLRHSEPTALNFWFFLFVICLGLTFLDIAVVESYYRPLQAWNSIIIWHLIYKTIFLTVPVIACYYFKTLAPLATWFFFIFGLEDTVFYALQGCLPSYYPGVTVLWFWEPSLELVLQINSIGLLVILLFGMIASKKPVDLFYRLETFVNEKQQPLNTPLNQETTSVILGD